MKEHYAISLMDVMFPQSQRASNQGCLFYFPEEKGVRWGSEQQRGSRTLKPVVYSANALMFIVSYQWL